MNYDDFLRAKVTVADRQGFDVDESELSVCLKPHQRDIVRWALAGGRRAIFAAFGLGKTLMQLEIARLIVARTGGRFLIVAPLGVRQEFIRDGLMLGLHVKFIRRIEEAEASGIYITNYETVRDGKLSPLHFIGSSLDEAAVLRGFGGSKTFREFMRLFAGDDRSGTRTAGVKYRFVATATPSPNEFIELLAYSAYLDVMDIGQAKAQPLDAKILTPTGWRTMGELAVGDQVIAGDGSITRVLGVYPQGERQIFRVTFNDGGSTECDAEHLWLTHTQYERNNEKRYVLRNGPDAPRVGRFASVRTTEEIAATLRGPQDGANHSVPVAGVAQFFARPVPIDPWLLGALLGDACLRESSITFSTMDEWMVARVDAALPAGLHLRVTARGTCDYGITTTGRHGGRGPNSNPLLSALRAYGLLGKRSWEKSVPRDYLVNSAEVRLSVLRGLMDTDGCFDQSNGATFTTTSCALADDVVWLVRSLGGLTVVNRRATPGRDAYKVAVKLPAGTNPFSLPRKAEKVRPKSVRAMRRYITAVELAGKKPAQCIAIEHPSRLYITDDFAVTHNTRFFKRDSTKADSLTIHPHKVREFWLWVASWAMFIERPSDLGHSDDGYVLPDLDVRWHELPSDHNDAGHEAWGQGRLLKHAAIGVVDGAREKRESLPVRVAKLAEIRAEDPLAHRIIWHDLEAERHAIERAIPGVASVWGAQDLEEREQRVADFADGLIPELAAKPVMLGSGCNLQRHCHWAIFLGIGFKFQDFFQAVHRVHRFLQTKQVRIDLIYTESEREVRRILEQKWQQHNEQREQMTAIIKEFGLSQAAIAQALQRSIGVDRIEVTGEGWTAVNTDTVTETRAMQDQSVHLILTSIPFSTQYEYTPSYNDFGHTDSNAHFWQQMDFLTPELFRVLKPGRICCIHVKDRIVPGGLTGLGFQTVYPFHVDAISHFTRHGFGYMGMKTIVTDVVRENNQTYRLGYTEQCKDGTKMGVGMPEYLLMFRRPPSSNEKSYSDEPVIKNKGVYSRSRWQTDAHAFARSNGNRLLRSEELEGLTHEQLFKLFKEYSQREVYDYEHHVRIGEALEAEGRLPVTFMLLQPQSWSDEVWSDVTRMLTLNGAQSAAGREAHLCPMQFDIADRAITQFTNKGELVFDPFGGLMTVPYRALKLGRSGRGHELNPRYFFDGVQYLKAIEREVSMPTLFDFEELKEEA